MPKFAIAGEDATEHAQRVLLAKMVRVLPTTALVVHSNANSDVRVVPHTSCGLPGSSLYS